MTEQPRPLFQSTGPPPRKDLRRIAGVGLFTLGALALWTGGKSSTAVLYGEWYRPYALVTGALLIASAIALWSRRSWGAWLGAAVIVADAALVCMMGETRWPLLLLTLGVAALGLLASRGETDPPRGAGGLTGSSRS